ARAVDLEGPLDADTRGDAPDGDRAGDATAAQAHDGPLQHLDALAVALDDLGGDLHGVTRGELRQVGTELILDDLVEHVHAAVPWSGGQQGLRWGRWRRPRKGRPAPEYSTGSTAGRVGRRVARGPPQS